MSMEKHCFIILVSPLDSTLTVDYVVILSSYRFLPLLVLVEHYLW